MKKSIQFFLLCFLVNGLTLFAQQKTYNLYFDNKSPQLKFGIDEIKIELEKQGINTQSNSISKFRSNSNSYSIVFSFSKTQTKDICTVLGIKIAEFTKPQSYSIRKVQTSNKTTIAVLAIDDNAAMYGALDIAEAIRLGTLNELQNSDKSPFVENRGIKFNMSLDMRSPTYSDRNDANQQNIPEMWSMDFWKEMLDEMARDRYNVISLWSLHPFPSMVKVPEFPDVALNDVWRKTAPDKEDLSGNKSNNIPLVMTEGHEIVKKITIDEKIKFWQDVMQYGKDRGVTFYLFTWNIFTHGTDGKYGITDDQNNEKTIAYFRASTREMVKTYPLLAGIGITAGEHMQDLKGEYSNENWLWNTYGLGVSDALKAEPNRKFRLTHRFHLSSQSEILNAWKDFPGDFDFSFKYLYAHMYSDTKSEFIKPALQYIAAGMKMWLELRNDDIYSFRWGDPDFAREFINNLPSEDKLAGFYMGPDGYCWGREFLSTEPENPRQLVMKKQWLSFMLWGRLSFDPTIPNTHFQKVLAVRFPKVPADKLYRASCEASKIFPEITRFFWGDIDVKWFPEACVTRGTFYTVKDFIMQGTMPGTDDINIKIWRGLKLNGEKIIGKTPLDVAASLQSYAKTTLALVDELRKIPSNNKELRITLGDYEAFAHLGNYYAEKILGAANIALYDTTMVVAQKMEAINHLEKALDHWKKYATIYCKQNLQPIQYGRAGLVDIPGKLTKEVANDILLVKNWQTGSITGPVVKRKELNFRP